MATTFKDVLESLKKVTNAQAEFAAEPERLSADMRYHHKEREVVGTIATVQRNVEANLRVILTDVASLAVAHSDMKFDEIIKL